MNFNSLLPNNSKTNNRAKTSKGGKRRGINYKLYEKANEVKTEISLESDENWEKMK